MSTLHYPTNRIITRGMGVSRGLSGRTSLVTQGYGGPVPGFVAEAFRSVRVGQSGTKRKIDQLDEVIIWAKLIEVNKQPAPPPDVKGWIKVKVDRNSHAAVLAEHISSRVRAAWETIRVTVRRLK